MDRLTEEQLTNEVHYLHSLHRQGPPNSNTSSHPISNPSLSFSNPNYNPNSPIFNHNTSSIHPISNPYHFPSTPNFSHNPNFIHPVANPNSIPNYVPNFGHNPNFVQPVTDPNRPFVNPGHAPSFNANHNFISSVTNPIFPILNPNHIPNGPIIGPNYSSIRPNAHGPSLPISYQYTSDQSNAGTVNTRNLNDKFRRLSVAVELKKPKKNRKKKGGNGDGNGELKKWPPIPEKEWPSNPSPKPTSEWPILNLKPAPVDRVLTAEEHARLVATKAQENALDAAKGMFQKSIDSDGEVDDDSDNCMDEDEEEEEEEEKEVEEEFKFFTDLFREDSELRSYYEKNWESGQFSCLVCAGIGQKVGKKFKDCVALVQHSISIAKTKKRRAHRALARAICEVLGWDIQKLPSVNLPKICESEVVDKQLASDGNTSVDHFNNCAPSTQNE